MQGFPSLSNRPPDGDNIAQRSSTEPHFVSAITVPFAVINDMELSVQGMETAARDSLRYAQRRRRSIDRMIDPHAWMRHMKARVKPPLKVASIPDKLR